MTGLWLSVAPDCLSEHDKLIPQSRFNRQSGKQDINVIQHSSTQSYLVAAIKDQIKTNRSVPKSPVRPP